MNNSLDILGVKFNKLDLQETLHRISSYLSEGRQAMIVTANPEIIMTARRERDFAEILSKADIITPDGIGVVIASRIFGSPLKGRVTGIDLCYGLFKLASQKGYGVYFLGAHPEVVEKAVSNVKKQYPELDIVGYHHGYFKSSEEVVNDIKETKPEILLAALGMGKQEQWISRYQAELGVSVAMGVGGSFDVFAGTVKRAPYWMQKMGLEWLYRLIKQPSRFFRMLVLPKFLLIVTAKRLGFKV